MSMSISNSATWQETFESHPIAKIRAFEAELRSSALRDKERLRLLVGHNYRDLLATADDIIELNKQSHQVESALSQLSKDCRAPDLDAPDSSITNDNIAQCARVQLAIALLRLTARCARDRNVSIGSKAFVLARLLVKHLGETQQSNKSSHFLNSRLKECRRRLLWSIDQLLTRPNTSPSALIEAAVAYCLSTNASATEVVSHMYDLRAQRLARTQDSSDAQSALNELIQRCQYIIATRSTTKLLASRRVTEILGTFQNRPILQDSDLQAIPSLQLDTLSLFLPTDIVNFTPYFKRTGATLGQADKLFRDWVNHRSVLLVQQTKAFIGSNSLPQVLRARTEILNHLLPSAFSCHLHERVIPNIQACFTDRIEELLNSQSGKLLDLHLESFSEPIEGDNNNFWRSVPTYSSYGATKGKHLASLRGMHFGLDKNARGTLHTLRRWLNDAQRTRSEIQKLFKHRWQDRLEEYDTDEDDTEDDSLGQSTENKKTLTKRLVTKIGQEEPMRYQRTFEKSVTDASQSLIDALVSRAKATLQEESGEDPAPRYVAILRLIRESRHALQMNVSRETLFDLDASTQQITLTLVQNIIAMLIERLTEDSSSGAKKSFVADDLPSPRAIRLLEHVCSLMSERGGLDIWDSSSVALLKNELLQKILESDKRGQILVTDFDSHYIKIALTPADGIDATEGVARKAGLYWLRTKMLFGMLDIA